MSELEKVERYECTNGNAQSCYGCYTMDEHDEGDYVKSEDYDALAEEVARLKRERERLIPLARRALWIAYTWNDHNHDPAHICARQEAEKLGLNSIEEANDFLCKTYGWTEDRPNEQ